MSRVALAMNALALIILDNPSRTRESVCDMRSRSFLPQTMAALATIDAVTLVLIASAEDSYARFRPCSVFLSQVSRIYP